jgi:exosortase
MTTADLTALPSRLPDAVRPPAARLRPVSLYPILVFAGVLAVLYSVVLRDLALTWWDDPNYSHGFLVPVFSGWLIWQRRQALLALEARGHWIGLPLLAAGVVALVLGDVGAEFFLMRSSLVVILAGLVLFHFGIATFRAVAFPLGFLMLMIPLPAIFQFAISLPLQRFAAENAAGILELLGVPVLLDGNVITLSQITLGVTEACSGIRSLISLVALAIGWAYMSFSRTWAVVALTAAAVPITIAANAGRIVGTGLIGQWFGIEYASGFFHEFSGWLVFVFAVACLLGLSSVARLGGRFVRRGAA